MMGNPPVWLLRCTGGFFSVNAGILAAGAAFAAALLCVGAADAGVSLFLFTDKVEDYPADYGGNCQYDNNIFHIVRWSG